eukprot:CAMPEP_0184674066 /NCGR_PEP_ID=MMETSP0308-20130426/87030_1 /TAXON_ID=38269 /ORGANISM="Gloeochaete witrockiana, Strain SAG 46.84" /LENGTH=438 /DNA_ID=CAMNT_0027121629 /DNA_START=920 /DNA_END=2236 /DNA_ORIENTATION=-
MINLYYCSSVILLFLVLPTSMTALAGFFGCLDLGGNNLFLLRDLSLACRSSEYSLWALAFALPLLILYGVIIPGLAALVLYRGRDQLHTIEFARKYGFLYMGYRREVYMYETFVAIRKNLLAVVLAVFVGSPVRQGLCAMGIMFVSLAVDVKVCPWESTFLNRLNAAGLMAVVITLYCGQFFYVTDDPSATITLTVIVVSVNALFWLTWIMAFLRKSLTDFVLNNPHLKICRSLQSMKVPIIEQRTRSFMSADPSSRRGSAFSLSDATLPRKGSAIYLSQAPSPRRGSGISLSDTPSPRRESTVSLSGAPLPQRGSQISLSDTQLLPQRVSSTITLSGLPSVLPLPRKGTVSLSDTSPFTRSRQDHVLVTEIPFDDIQRRHSFDDNMRRISLNELTSPGRGSTSLGTNNGGIRSLWEMDTPPTERENDNGRTIGNGVP